MFRHMLTLIGIVVMITPVTWGMSAGPVLSGRVYEGATGTEPPPLGSAQPLAGVTVALYGSNDAGNDGTASLPIQTTTTDAQGWYSLTARGIHEFYNIVQTNLPGYVDSDPSPAATSVGGTVKSSNWIQFRYEDLYITPVATTGNKFWDEQPGGPGQDYGTLDGYKRDEASGAGLANWRIFIDLNGNSQWDAGEPNDLTDNSGYYRIDYVAPGTYRVCEVMQTGWEGDSPCVEGITIIAGVTTTQDFHNRRTAGTGSVLIVKEATPQDDTAFLFCASYAPGGFFDTLCQTLRDPSSNQWLLASDLDRLISVSESPVSGWTLADIVITGDADGGSVVDLIGASVSVDFDEGEDIVITFRNRKTGDTGMDYGDAPLPYPEASHLLGGPYMGPFGDLPDAEQSMQRDVLALGDDNDADGDDENGLVSLNLVKTPGQWSSWEVKGYFNTSSDAVYGLWIDFNGDGDWDDTDELLPSFGFCGFGGSPQDWFQVIGAFALPAQAQVGTTYARLRVYDNCNAAISPGGAGGPGEVEDFVVEITADGPGLPPGGIVHGYKWHDLNGNGLWDVLNPVEPPLAGWTIWLDSNGSGVQDAGDMTAQTDATGHFRFVGVPAGTYLVGEQMEPGWVQTTPGGPGTYTETVTPGSGSFPLMFGNRQAGGTTGDGVICGSKWNDLNGDGLLDASEPMLSDWLIYLDLNKNGQHDPAEPFDRTDATGGFEFTGLAAGSYTVTEEQPVGWVQTWPGGTGTHVLQIQPGVQPACVLFGNRQTDGPGPSQDRDWGDAPDPTYPTLESSNGASHVVAPGFHLGGGVDAEADGQPTPGALGDDYATSDDEDGVFFVTPLMPGSLAEVEISASASGIIDAWVDFGADGSWLEMSDRILSGVTVAAGGNVLSFTVPATAAVDVVSYARFRFSTSGTLSPDGPAQDGEVEDYGVFLGPDGPAVPGEQGPAHVKWSQPPIEIDPVADPNVAPVYCAWGEPARSTHNTGSKRLWRIDADDFRCLGPIPITRVRWWGGYKGWTGAEPPESKPLGWHIGFWANQVEGLAEEDLFPERLVWAVEIPFERVGVEPAGWMEYGQAFARTCFEYEVQLEPGEWFAQAEFESNERIFWVSITAIYPEDIEQVNMWGWATRSSIWGRGAVVPAIFADWPSYDERLFAGRIYPVESSALCDELRPGDMCFELLTETPWVAWDEPFTGIRSWPDYRDEPAFGVLLDDGEQYEHLVFDDWMPESDTPVVAAAWWGSYVGHGYEPCVCEQVPQPVEPAYFVLTIAADEPASDSTPLSRPGETLWEYRAFEYEQVLVGYDRDPLGEPNEPVFRYSVALPAEYWFDGAVPGQRYWFNVLAVYAEPLGEIDHPWGWTNHPHEFGSSALAIDWTEPGLPEWRSVVGSEDLPPADMSFSLFTVP